MNDSLPIVSWRIVSVCATSPRITSWCATRPGRRTEWIGGGGEPLASAISSAGSGAGPPGPATLPSWGKSTVSGFPEWAAAPPTERNHNTPPVAEVGAVSTLAPRGPGRRPRGSPPDALGGRLLVLLRGLSAARLRLLSARQRLDRSPERGLVRAHAGDGEAGRVEQLRRERPEVLDANRVDPLDHL